MKTGTKKAPKSGPGKRSLYSPELGTSNYRKAEWGRFAYHEAFTACRKIDGALARLKHTASELKLRKLKARCGSIATHLESGLCMLGTKAIKLTSRGDKIRFAEAIAAFFNPPKWPDSKVAWVCREVVDWRTRFNEDPSQAELRQAVREKHGIKFSNREFESVLRRTGLDKELPRRFAK